MGLIKTGRAVIQYEYTGEKESYGSVLLTLEFNYKYGLPGGVFDPKHDNDTLDTVVREVSEELGLSVVRSSSNLFFTFEDEYCSHDVYVVSACGELRTDDAGEIKGIGFLNLETSTLIPDTVLEPHVIELRTNHLARLKSSINHGITIPQDLIKSWDEYTRILS